MNMTDTILKLLPIWVLIIIAILWAAEKFIFPFFAKFRDTTVTFDQIADLKEEMKKLRDELTAWERKYDFLDANYRGLQVKYNSVIGMLRGFQVYLRDKGMSDFPMIDELNKHTES